MVLTAARTSLVASLLLTLHSVASQQQNQQGTDVYDFVDAGSWSSGSTTSGAEATGNDASSSSQTSLSDNSTRAPFMACTLHCPEYAPCKFGFMRNTSASATYTGTFPFMNGSGSSKNNDAADMYCDCPPGFMGPLCQTQYTQCGDFTCLNGGSCLTRVENGKTINRCDCTTSYTAESSFTGLYCEYQATSYCTKNSGMLFCTNNGRCREDPYQGCDCDSPFTGFSCELLQSEGSNSTTSSNTNNDHGMLPNVYTPFDNAYVLSTLAPDACELDCQNNGTCQFGAKDLGALNDFVVNAPHLNETTTENYQHCVCPDGFHGLYCEETMSKCDQAAGLICLHGAKCEFDADGEEVFWSCDCSTANSTKADTFAGESCEHPVNDICSVYYNQDATPLSFCVNGGTCNKRVTDEEDHPGCKCVDGYEGPHCELRSGSMQSGNSSNVTIETGITSSPASSSAPAVKHKPLTTYEIIVLIVSILAIALVSVFSVTIYLQGRRRKDRQMTNMMRWSSSYRDYPVNNRNINLAPRRQSSVEPDFNTPMSSALITNFKEPYRMTTSNSFRAAPTATAALSFSSGNDNDPDEPDGEPEIYIGPPRDEDGHELHNVEIL